ncbi:hypothetical protein [Pedobacter arcticus]|uniref:hypothetical protein n=1 Tax=Pedobacter arcticus TaxID=752140 RepID=UPI00037EF5D9|nr:hypothetical protein [Pedobacter arcticus]
MLKKLKLTLVVLALTATASFAQTKNVNERIDSVINNVMKLDAETKVKFLAFLKENANGNKAIKKDETLNDEQKAEQIKAYKREMDAKLITIITREQKNRWREFTGSESRKRNKK